MNTHTHTYIYLKLYVNSKLRKCHQPYECPTHITNSSVYLTNVRNACFVPTYESFRTYIINYNNNYYILRFYNYT